MKITAPAKLNLYLHITDRRDDGYHLLDSLFAFTKFGDEITITPSPTLSLTIDGPFSSVLKNETIENNLIFRAALLLKNKYAVNNGAQIHITKQIPVAAGLGGGSSDAAAVLKALNQLWELQLCHEKLADIGLTLGADIPACLYQKTALVSGIGEQIQPLTLPCKSFVILLVNPNLPLSTQTVFKQYHQNHTSFSSPINPDLFKVLTDDLTLQNLLSQLHNDLEPAATTLLPAIGDIISFFKKQHHCTLARMSGSGPTCFGLFSDLPSAELALQNLKRLHPTHWAIITRFVDNELCST